MSKLLRSRNPIRQAGLVLTAFSLTAGLWCASAAAQSDVAHQGASARVIVKLKEGSTLLRRQALSSGASERVAQARVRALAEDLGAQVGVKLVAGQALTERLQVLSAQGMTSEQLARRLSAQAEVEYAVVDHRRKTVAVPNDPLYAAGPPIATGKGGPEVGQWYLRAPSTAVLSSINAEGAWNVTTGNPSIVVAVLDSGVRFDHVDLKRVSEGGSLLDGYDFVSNDFIGHDESAGRDSDPSDPGDGVTAEDVASPSNNIGCGVDEIGSSSWHGTSVSGLIGAVSDNGVGMASVGRGVRVLPVRVLGRCGGYDSDIIAGMRWAAGLSVPGTPENPGSSRARVINLSLGGGGDCQAYDDVVSELSAVGVAVVAAAGNSAGQPVGVPAKCAGVIGVAGLRHLGTKVGYSDLGPEISISAPAGNCVNTGEAEPCLYPIVSTSNSGSVGPVAGGAGAIYSDAFRPTVGTSFSSPLVAGTVALMLSVRPSLTAAEVRQQLRATARPFPTTGAGSAVVMCTAETAASGEECYCTTSTCGAGMLDAGAAVLAVSGSTGGGTPPRPDGGGGSGGGGGGGAVTSLYWLLGIAAAAVALRRVQRVRVRNSSVSQRHDTGSL